jgi:hypothetical protein
MPSIFIVFSIPALCYSGKTSPNYFQDNVKVATDQPFSQYFEAFLIWGGDRWRFKIKYVIACDLGMTSIIVFFKLSQNVPRTFLSRLS